MTFRSDTSYAFFPAGAPTAKTTVWLAAGNPGRELNNHQMKLVGLGYGLEVLIRVA